MTVFHVDVVEAAEYERLAIIACHYLIAPRDEAQIKQRSTHFPVLINLIYSAQIHSDAEASQPCAIYIGTVHAHIRTASFIVAQLRLIPEALH